LHGWRHLDRNAKRRGRSGGRVQRRDQRLFEFGNSILISCIDGDLDPDGCRKHFDDYRFNRDIPE